MLLNLVYMCLYYRQFAKVFEWIHIFRQMAIVKCSAYVCKFKCVKFLTYFWAVIYKRIIGQDFAGENMLLYFMKCRNLETYLKYGYYCFHINFKLDTIFWKIIFFNFFFFLQMHEFFSFIVKIYVFEIFIQSCIYYIFYTLKKII